VGVLSQRQQMQHAVSVDEPFSRRNWSRAAQRGVCVVWLPPCLPERAHATIIIKASSALEPHLAEDAVALEPGTAQHLADDVQFGHRVRWCC
jgi:hypothetical protein